MSKDIYTFFVKNKYYPSTYDFLTISHGEANGYVAVPPTHPLYKLNYDVVNAEYPVDPHGDFTFSGLTSSNEVLLHHASNAGVPKDYWILGFDTMHIGDNAENWSIANVEKELDRIAKQIIALNHS